ncbi:nucleotidyltransferase [Mesorhizobium sp. M1A.F.Ca.IN.022.06.1.1]|uniref:nucleotidyltransferase domain-containing protein n=1 Tax=Mesorhizobium sp. M1A.F.Ca.IN.022.06.1.1 TaxID=2493680 RepID=UPI000F75C654|nr:nucleotidyltransferase [Mesorhizobium sp. M1A.F.Ca.IN.022.06.1.1]AZO59674.1 nucleotidyltransferase [Mesorhizobium sp. M1A.F.Ca.IN.022.06.1.1]
MSDAYLQGILAREAVDTGLSSPVRGVQAALMPVISGWAGNKLLSVNPSGSFAKGTANHSGTDIDLFISLSEDTAETLQQIYELLFKKLTAVGYAPKRQNVSINIRVNGYDVDLVPAKRQNSLSSDHSLYRRRANTWTKTNVQTHIATVWAGGRQQESRLIKLWRDQKGLDFPSFYVELAVIEALRNTNHATLSERVLACLIYLRDRLPNARFVDPANTNNVISDDLTAAEKQRISAAAAQAINGTWGQFVK